MTVRAHGVGAIRAKVAELVSESFEGIAQIILDLEEELEQANGVIDGLRQMVTDFEAEQ